MKRIIASLFIAIISIVLCTKVYALFVVTNEGLWPENWPKELEPLRKQSRTKEGPKLPQRQYEIPFAQREEFEGAWPHLLKVKTPSCPLIVLKGPIDLGGKLMKAGVCVHTPPVSDQSIAPDKADAAKPHGRWRTTATYIQLIVDGQIVDLNRIQLPADTPIIDERFSSKDTK